MVVVVRVGIYPRDMRPCDDVRPSFGPEDAQWLQEAGAELDADGYYYAYTFAAASALHKYVNDHYTLDLWARAVSLGHVKEDERTSANLEKLATRGSGCDAKKAKKKPLPRDQTTLG